MDIDGEPSSKELSSKLINCNPYFSILIASKWYSLFGGLKVLALFVTNKKSFYTYIKLINEPK